MVTRALRIALVGGGLGGLAAAIALSRRGFDVRIFEQSNEIKEVGAGITLTPNAVKILSALGLEAGIKKHGFGIDGDAKLEHRASALPSRIQGDNR